MSPGEKIINALTAANGTKTAKEIADECKCDLSWAYNISNSSGLPYKRVMHRSSVKTVSPVPITRLNAKELDATAARLREETAQAQERLNAQLKQLEAIEARKVALRAVSIKPTEDGLFCIWANGEGVRMDQEQLTQLKKLLTEGRV